MQILPEAVGPALAETFDAVAVNVPPRQDPEPPQPRIPCVKST
jgi:hypothetical protein